MKTCNIPHKIVKAFARNFARGVLVDTVKQLHNIGVVGNFKIGAGLLAELLNLDVFAVVPADGNACVHNVRNLHLNFKHSTRKLVLFCLKRL